MPQELQVLRCYSCQFFQVHIVKKSRKWECKMCGEKQSIKKVYGRGSGQECRVHVQKLNRLASLQQENQITAYESSQQDDVHLHNRTRLNVPVSSSSKWSVFLDKSNYEDTSSESHKQNASNSSLESMGNEELTTFRTGKYSQTQHGHVNKALSLSANCCNDTAQPDSIYRHMQEDSLTDSSENKWLKYMNQASGRSNKQLSDHNLNPETVCNESVLFKTSSNWDMYQEKPVYEAGGSKLAETSAQLMSNNKIAQSNDTVQLGFLTTAMKATEKQMFPREVTTSNVHAATRECSAFDRDYNEDELNSILDI